MKAVLPLATGGFGLSEIPPPVVTPGDILVEMKACGLCGTDLAKLSQPQMSVAVRLVHEFAGGLWGDFSGAAYQASKHGIVGLANATRMEERLNGIRVTVIYPGLCDTPSLNNRPVPPTKEQRDLMMKPEDIAQACVFAASLPPRTYVSDLVLMPGALQCNGHPVG